MSLLAVTARSRREGRVAEGAGSSPWRRRLRWSLRAWLWTSLLARDAQIAETQAKSENLVNSVAQQGEPARSKPADIVLREPRRSDRGHGGIEHDRPQSRGQLLSAPFCRVVAGLQLHGRDAAASA